MKAWEERLAALPADAGLLTKIEAIVYCGVSSGEHQRGRTYYCCEKVDALLELIAPDVSVLRRRLAAEVRLNTDLSGELRANEGRLLLRCRALEAELHALKSESS